MSIQMKGKLKLGNQKAKLNTFMAVNETINLDYTYDSNGGKWIFNLESVSSAIFTAINQGKTIQMQLARRMPHNNINTVQRDKGLLLSLSSIYKYPDREPQRYTFPNFIAVASPGDGGIPEDKKARINITREVKKGIKNIDLTNWVNNMIFYESILTTKKFNTLTPTKQDLFLNSNGTWFSILRFVLLIDNQRYALTNRQLKIIVNDLDRNNYSYDITIVNSSLIEVRVSE